MLKALPHTAWWLLPISTIWNTFQRLHLVRLQEAWILLQNFWWVDLTAASFVLEHVRQSPVVESKLESVILSHDSWSDSDSSWLWSVSFSLMPKVKSLSWSPELPKVSAATPSSGTASFLAGLEGGSKGSDSDWLKLWLDASVAFLLLASLASSVLEQVLLPQWSSGASLVEHSHH